MPTSIDQLEIKLNANAVKANTAIDELVGKIDKLTTSLGKLDGSGGKLNTLAGGVQNLSNAMQSMSNVKTTDFTKFANSISKFSNINVASMKNVAAALPGLSKSLNQIGNVSVNAQNFAELAKSIARLGNKSAVTAVTNIPKLATAMKKLMAELAKAPKVSQNLIDMTNALANLARTGASSGRAAKSLSTAFEGINKSSGLALNGIKKMGVSLSGLMRQILPFVGIWQIFSLGKTAIEFSSDLTEVQNVVDVTFGEFRQKVEDLASVSIADLGMSELTTKQLAGRFQAMGTAMGIAKGEMADMSVELTRLTGDMASFYNVEQADVGKALQSVFTGETEPMRRYGIDLTNATIQQWALNKGINANVNSMTQAEKALLRYQYVMDNTWASQGDFIRTADTWANQVRVLKEQLRSLAGVIGGTLINALKPFVKAMNVAIAKVISFAKIVSNALGKIFGWKYEESSGGAGMADDFGSAADSAEDIAGSTGTAADNIKKMRAGLRAFDELKVVNMPDTSSGGGSGGSGGSGGAGGASSADGGKWVPTTSMFDFESDINTLYQLGERIELALSETLEGIDWNKIYEKARNFGSGLASFLNGLISPRLFGDVGRTIASALNTAIQAALSFGQTFDFEDFGLSIAAAINEFFATFDFAGLAKTLNTWVDGIKEAISTAIKNTDWDSVKNSLKEFLRNIELDTVAVIGAITIASVGKILLSGGALSAIGSSISKQIAKAIASKLGITIGADTGIAAALGIGLQKAFSGIKGFSFFNPGDIATVFGAGTFGEKAAFLTKGLAGIGLIIGGVTAGVEGFTSMWEEGFNVVDEVILGIGGALGALGLIILGVGGPIAWLIAAIGVGVATVVILIKDHWEQIKEFVSGIAEWVNDHVIQPVVNFFKGMRDKIVGFFRNAWGLISGVWKVVSDWFYDRVIEPIVKFFSGFARRVQQIFERLWIIVQAVWIIVSSWFKQHVIDPVVNLFLGLKDKVVAFFKTAWSMISGVWAVVSGWFKQKVIDPVVNFFSGIVSKISGPFSNAWNKIKGVWGSVTNWFKSTIINPIQNAFNTCCTKIKGFFDNLWSGIRRGVVSAFNTVISKVEGGINGIVNGINRILTPFNNLVKKAAKITGANWDGVDLVSKVSLPRIKGYADGGFIGGDAPKSYSLFMAGENSVPEMLGTVGGRNAVAGGAEITGIKAEVRATSDEQVALLKRQNALLERILAKEFGITKEEIGKAARDWGKGEYRRSGNQVFAY